MLRLRDFDYSPNITQLEDGHRSRINSNLQLLNLPCRVMDESIFYMHIVVANI